MAKRSWQRPHDHEQFAQGYERIFGAAPASSRADGPEREVPVRGTLDPDTVRAVRARLYELREELAGEEGEFLQWMEGTRDIWEDALRRFMTEMVEWLDERSP